MTRRAVWIALGLCAAVALFLTWFVRNFEPVPVIRHQAAGPEARRDPYLALERFLARMGRAVQRIGNAGAFDALGSADVLILDRNRRRALGGARGERLRAWVESGGYLLVAAEWPGVDDPLLEALGVGWQPAGGGECPAVDAAVAPAADGFADESPWTSARLPGSGRPLALELDRVGLQAPASATAWRVDLAGRGATLLHFERGRGQVTVLASLARLADNGHIGRRDHAEVVWTLLEHYRPEGRVWLATRLEVPTLGRWLADSAWMVLVSAAVLLAAWLAHVVPRFGGLVPAPVAGRRSLMEHLAAMGRFVAASGGLTFLLETVRGALHARVALRRPEVASLAPAERRRALARITRLPQEALRQALEAPVRGRAAFTQAISTLQQIEARL